MMIKKINLYIIYIFSHLPTAKWGNLLISIHTYDATLNTLLFSD